MTVQPLHFGVAGLGFGAKIHLPGLLSLAGVKVTGIVGTDVDRTARTAKEWRVPKAFGSLEDFFREKFDAVTLALPPDQNEKAVRMALERGMPILSEKPLAATAKAARALAQLGQKTVTVVNFQFPEVEAFQKLKRILEGQKYGAVRSVHVSWLVESFAQQHKQWSWKTDAHRGGGVMALLGSHFLYLAEWLLGPLEGILAKNSNTITSAFAPPATLAAEDSVSLMAQTKGGVSVTAQISNASPGGTGHRWEIVCDCATLVLYNSGPDYMDGFELRVRTQTTEEVLVPRPKALQGGDGRLVPFISLAQRFVDAVRSGEKTYPDFLAGARVQSLMEVVWRSSAKSRYSKVP